MEERTLVLKPHPLAFLHFHAICAFWIAASLVYRHVVEHPECLKPFFEQLAAKLPVGSEIVVEIFSAMTDFFLKTPFTRFLLWASLLVFPTLVVGTIYITARPLLYATLLTLLGAWLCFWRGVPPENLAWLSVFVGAVGIPLVDLYRRGHEYVITPEYICVGKVWPSGQKRLLRYDAILDLVVDQGLLGKLFNYGTVNPITATGLGMGEDYAFVGVHGGAFSTKKGLFGGGFLAGGRSIKRPRVASYWALYGVPDPHRVCEIIFSRVRPLKPTMTR